MVLGDAASTVTPDLPCMTPVSPPLLPPPSPPPLLEFQLRPPQELAHELAQDEAKAGVRCGYRQGKRKARSGWGVSSAVMGVAVTRGATAVGVAGEKGRMRNSARWYTGCGWGTATPPALSVVFVLFGVADTAVLVVPSEV